MPTTFTFEEVSGAPPETARGPRALTFSFEDAQREEESGLPSGLSERQRKRLELGSEMLAERARGEAAERTVRRLDTIAIPAVEGVLDALSFQPSRIVGNIERGIEGAATIAQGKTEDGALKPGEEMYQLPVHPSETLARPLVTIPQVPTAAEDSRLKQVGAGAVNAVVDLANFIQSPDGVAMFGIAGLPKATQQAVAASMAGTMAGHMPEQFAAAHAALGKRDYNEATRQVLGGVGAGVFAGLLARHGVAMPRVPKSPEFPATVDPDLAARNLAAPGTFGRANERQMYGPPQVDAPGEMFTAGEVPFNRMTRFGELPPVEILERGEGRGEKGELRTKEELETRGKVSFGAEAPTLLRTAVEEAPPKGAEGARKTFSFEDAQNPKLAEPPSGDKGRSMAAAEERQKLLDKFNKTTESEVAKSNSAKPEVRESVEEGLEIIDVGNNDIMVQITREEGGPWKVWREGEFSHVYSHADKARAIEYATSEWRDQLEAAGYQRASKVYEANPEQTIYEMHKHLDLPTGWTLRDTAMSKTSTYFMVTDAAGKQYKLRISDHEPSVFREREFGGNDAVFYANPMTPENFAAALVRVEKWLNETARESRASGETSSQHGSLKTAKQTSIPQEQGASAVPATESRMVTSAATKSDAPAPVKPGLISGTQMEMWADTTIQRSKSLGVQPVGGPELLAAYAVKGAALVERGVRDFSKWSAEMVREFGEEIRPHLQGLYSESVEGVKKVMLDDAVAKHRKLAGRGMQSPEVPKEHRQKLASDPSAFYEPQKMQRVEDAVESMSSEQLAGVQMVQADGPNNIWVASQLELYRRAVAAGQLDAAWGIMENAMKAGTSLGQLVNQFKQLKGATPDGVMLALNRRLITAGRDPLRPSEMLRVRRLAEQSIEANTEWRGREVEYTREPSDVNFERAVEARAEAIEMDAQLQQVVRAYDPRSFFDTLSTVLQGNLLAPISIVANVTGNMNNLLLRGSARSMASVVDAVDAHVRSRPRQQTVAPMRGSMEAGRAVARSVPAMGRTLARGASDLELAKVDARHGLQPLVALRDLLAGKAARLPRVNGRVPLAETAARALEASPFAWPAAAFLRSLAATDLPFRNAARARLITEAMKLRHLRGGEKATAKEIRQAVEYPELFLDPAELARIDRETLAAVYQARNPGSAWLMGAVNRSHPFVRFLFRTVAPYVTTPVNIVGEILSYVPPTALANVIRHAAKGDARQTQLAAAKFVLGSTVTAAGVWLYNKGLLSPGFDESDEPAKGRMLAHEVLPPNHINLSGLERAMSGGDPAWRTGDRTVDVMRGGGVAGALMLNAANALRRLERQPAEPNAGEELAAMILPSVPATLGYVVNQSYMRGTASLLDAVRGQKVDQWWQNYANTLGAIGAPNTLNALARATREYKPEVEGDDRFKTFENVLRNKVGATRALPYRRDLWGRPIPETPEGAANVAYQFFDISKTRKIPNDEVALELYTLWRRTGDASVIPTPPDDRFTRGRETYQLNKEQVSRLQELVGARRRQLVERVIATERWPVWGPAEKTRVLNKAWERGAETGRGEFWMERRGELEAKPRPKGFQSAEPYLN